MYLGVVCIDIFAHYVFPLLHKLYPFCFCIIMLVLLLYSPIHYFVLASIVLPFFFPDAYLASPIVPLSTQATLTYN